MTRMIFLVAVFLGVLSPLAFASDAHHEAVVVQKLRDATGKVVGARFHMIVDPKEYDTVRVNLGKMKARKGPYRAMDMLDDHKHRLLGAGVIRGYVRHQLIELRDIPVKPGLPLFDHELQELKLDLVYGAGNKIAAGEWVDLYTAYTHSGSSDGKWHVYGMHDGPAEAGDRRFVYRLPTDTSAHDDATDFVD